MGERREGGKEERRERGKERGKEGGREGGKKREKQKPDQCKYVTKTRSRDFDLDQSGVLHIIKSNF